MCFLTSYTNTVTCSYLFARKFKKLITQNNGPARESYQRNVRIANRTAQDHVQAMKSFFITYRRASH